MIEQAIALVHTLRLPFPVFPTNKNGDDQADLTETTVGEEEEEEKAEEDDDDDCCPVCLEQVPPRISDRTISLCGACRREVCLTCQTLWWDQTCTKPCCPVCLKEAPREDLLQALGLSPDYPLREEEEEEVDVGAMAPPFLRAIISSVELPQERQQAISNPVVEELLWRWLERNKAKRCPSCGVWIIRDDGCDHMTCELCHHEFCFYCLLPFEECEMPYCHRAIDDGEDEVDSLLLDGP